MSIFEKAKEKIEKLADQVKSPNHPADSEEELSETDSAVLSTDDPAVGADPELDPSGEDQYDID